jgi:hypothetical protein
MRGLQTENCWSDTANDGLDGGSRHQTSASRRLWLNGSKIDVAATVVAEREPGRSMLNRGLSMLMFFHPTPLACSPGMVRTEVVNTLGGFEGRAWLVERVHFHPRAKRRSGSAFINRKVLDYRIRPTSLIRSKPSSNEFTQTYRLMYRSYRRDYDSSQVLALELLCHIVGRLA